MDFYTWRFGDLAIVETSCFRYLSTSLNESCKVDIESTVFFQILSRYTGRGEVRRTCEKFIFCDTTTAAVHVTV